MTTTPSTLRTFRIGGQLDPAWLATTTPWTHVRATATLSRPDDGAPIVDPTNGAHEHPTTVVETLTAAQADGQWRTPAIKPTVSTGPDLALQPTGLTWTVTLEIKRGATWHEVIDYTVAPSGDRDYAGLSETITVAGATCIDVNALIPPPTSIPPGDAFETAVLDVLTGNPSAIAADLSVSRTSTTVTVASSTGTDAILPAATTSLAGQLVAADKVKLDATSGTNTGDQTATTVPVTPSGNLAATTVQAGLVELQGDINTLTTAVAPVAAAVSTTAGTGDAGKLVKLAATGRLGPAMLPAYTTDRPLDPRDEYGGIGDGSSRPLSTRYGSLGAAQAVYPHATALTDEIDWCALQGVINDSMTTGAPSSTIRLGRRPVLIPSGTWILNKPLAITSVMFAKIEGMGTMTRLCPTATMDAVVDIDGISFSTIGSFIIRALSLTPVVTNAISYQWTPAAARSTSSNLFHDIRIMDTNFVNGVGIGNLAGSDHRQVDNTQWWRVDATGGRSTLYVASTGSYVTSYQVGRPGTGQGNLIAHDFYSCGAARCETGWEINNIGTMNVHNPKIGNIDTACDAKAGGFNLHFSGFRTEHVGTLLRQVGGSSPAQIEFDRFMYDGTQETLANGRVFTLTGSGMLAIRNALFHSPGAAVPPHVYTASSVPQLVIVDGVAAPHASAGPGASSFVRPAGATPTSVAATGYLETSPTDGTTVAAHV